MRVRDRAQAVGRRLPAPLKALVKWTVQAIDPLLVWVAKRRYGYREPIPPARLRLRVGTTYLRDFIGASQPTLDEFEVACRGQGSSLRDARSLLDFGCGCGRLLLAMRRSQLFSECRLVGCDVDAEAIDWLRGAYPDLELAVNSFLPPLPFEDEEFDVVVSYSVFTHLDEQAQFAWLRELRRVLSPGGIALLTVQGPRSYESFRDGSRVANGLGCARRVSGHESLEREGFVYESFDRNAWNESDFTGIDSDYGLSFHSREYIERSWSPILYVGTVMAPPELPGGQEIVLARRA